MAQKEFWNLRRTQSTSRLAEWDHKEMDLETVICPLKEGHQRGGKRLADLSVVLASGTPQDFVWTWYSECLVQDSVLKLFKQNKFTGYEVKPVKARFKRTSKERELPILWELILMGWAGMAAPESGIRLVEHCDGCGHIVYSEASNPTKLIDASQWDGSDFFMVWPLPNYVFVTDRVAQVIRDNHLTGVVLKQPGELDLSGGFTPGRLSHSMPEARARELGAALGIE